MFKIDKSIKTESRLVVVGVREREWEVTTNEYMFTFGDDKNVLELDSDDGWATFLIH